MKTANIFFFAITILTAVFVNCIPESKLLKRNYVRINYDLSIIDTIMLSRVYTEYYDEKVFGFQRNKPSEKISWGQIPRKMQRKLDEFGVGVIPVCNSIDSMHRNISDFRKSNNSKKNYNQPEELDLFEKKEFKEIQGCNCGKRYVAEVYYVGKTRTPMNNFINNSYFYPLSILTLGIFKIRWNEGYSQMLLAIFDCNDKKVIYDGISSRYLAPSDSISIFKHLEILLAKYKDASDSMRNVDGKRLNVSH